MNKFCLAALACAGLALSQQASAAQIAIANADFEQGVVLTNGQYVAGSGWHPGWTDADKSTGRWNPTTAHFTDEAVRGHVAFTLGVGDLTRPTDGTLAQVVPNYLIQANTLYTLTLDVGRHFGTPDWNFGVGLLAGSLKAGSPTLLASLFGSVDHEGNAFQQGSFRAVKLSFQTGRTGPELRKPLAIALTSSRSGASFDAVRLEATPRAAVPEPASWAMMISGFGLVGGALRSRSRPTVTHPSSLV